MGVREITPSQASERRSFIELEHRLSGHEPLHVPEVTVDLHKRFKGKSPAYDEMDFALFVASDRDGNDVARCGAFVNRRWQRHHGEAAGFIGYYAASPDAGDASRALIEHAEGWLAARDATRVIAPVNGSPMHGMAALTDAFDESPMFPFGWNPPHVAAQFAAAGYERTYPLWVYEADLTSDAYRARVDAVRARPSCSIRPVDKAKWAQEMETMRLLFNEAFRTHWEFYDIDRGEWMELFGQMKPLVDPQQMIFAEVDGKAVGFCIGMPDFTPLFRSLKGKMGPVQIFKLMRGGKRYDRAGILGIGVSEAARGKGISAAMAAHVFEQYRGRGHRSSLYYVVNDDNVASRGLAESFGARGRVLYHGLDRSL